MNVLILNGSPRKNGNTSLMIREFLKYLNDEKFTHEILVLHGMKIKPCNDCRACKSGDLLCTVEDEMQDIYQKIDNSQLLIFATPIYWYTTTAQMKLLIDRLRPYYKNEKLKGKKAILFLPAGSGSGDCDLTIEMFKKVFNTLQVEFVGAATAKAYDEGDVLNDKIALKEIYELAHRVMPV